MAHDLKGIAATIGAQPLSDAARELEQALRAGVADAEVEPMLAPLAQRMREVLLALAEATEANGLDSLQPRSRDPHP